MKLLLVYPESSKEKWLTDFQKQYLEKINYFIKFEIQPIKTDSLSREQSKQKIKNESEKIEKLIKSTDHVILFDESGKTFKDSIDFSEKLVKTIEASPPRIVMIIGGAFGLEPALKAKHKNIWSLSKLTMNHHVAQMFLIEQIYRSLTIWKGRSYHN